MMKDSLFWRAAACSGLVMAGALIVSLWCVASRLEPCRSGAGARAADAPPRDNTTGPGGVIAVTAPENDLHRLYLVDRERRVILVYGNATGVSRFSLLAARFYDVDARAAAEREFPFNSRGYSILDMNRHVPKP